MTNDKAPREWWIRPNRFSSGFGSEEFLSDDNVLKPGREAEWKDDFYPCVTENEFKNGVHVIEKSAYDELKAELEAASAALAYYADKDHWKLPSTRDKTKTCIEADNGDEARGALAKVSKFLEGK